MCTNVRLSHYYIFLENNYLIFILICILLFLNCSHLIIKFYFHVIIRDSYHGTLVAANNITFIYSVVNNPSSLARSSARNLLAASELDEA